MTNNIKSFIEKNYNEEKFDNNIKLAEQKLAKCDNEENRHSLAEAKLQKRCLNHITYVLSNCDENEILDVEYNLNMKLANYCDEHTAEELDNTLYVDDIFKSAK